MADVSDAPWDGSSGRYTPAQWARACLIDRGVGNALTKQRYSLPVREPDGRLSRKGLAAAAARLNQTEGIDAAKRTSVARQLIRLYGQAGLQVPDHLKEMAGRAAGSANDGTDSPERCYTSGLVEIRSGSNGRTIGGYAAVFGQLSKPMPFGFELVDTHFFDESRQAGFSDVVARWNHDSFPLAGGGQQRHAAGFGRSARSGLLRRPARVPQRPARADHPPRRQQFEFRLRLFRRFLGAPFGAAGTNTVERQAHRRGPSRHPSVFIHQRRLALAGTLGRRPARGRTSARRAPRVTRILHPHRPTIVGAPANDPRAKKGLHHGPPLAQTTATASPSSGAR